MKMPMSQVATLKQRPTKDRFKPQASGKSCDGCRDKHSLEAQVRGIVCKCQCHKYQGY